MSAQFWQIHLDLYILMMLSSKAHMSLKPTKIKQDGVATLVTHPPHIRMPVYFFWF